MFILFLLCVRHIYENVCDIINKLNKGTTGFREQFGESYYTIKKLNRICMRYSML